DRAGRASRKAVDRSRRRSRPNRGHRRVRERTARSRRAAEQVCGRAAARRSALTDSLRAIEFAAAETLAGGGVGWKRAFPQANVHGPKLASDVVRFLVRAARLNPSFVARFDDAIEGRSPSARTQTEEDDGLGERNKDFSNQHKAE